MKTEMEERSCPKCGRTYTEYPALSRTDNKTLICPDCGIREALESMEVSKEEQEKIISIIHHSRLNKNNRAVGQNQLPRRWLRKESHENIDH